MLIDEQLARLSRDLTMPSESEEPFERVRFSGAARGFSKTRLRALLDAPDETQIVVRKLERVFRAFAFAHDWQSPTQAARVPKFRALLDALAGGLTDAKAYRVGAVRVRLYLIGRDGEDIAGLRTLLVET